MKFDPPPTIRDAFEYLRGIVLSAQQLPKLTSPESVPIILDGEEIVCPVMDNNADIWEIRLGLNSITKLEGLRE